MDYRAGRTTVAPFAAVTGRPRSRQHLPNLNGRGGNKVTPLLALRYESVEVPIISPMQTGACTPAAVSFNKQKHRWGMPSQDGDQEAGVL